jgi:phosphoribosylformylglycinamidine (FGAM) synthase-like amidotransferase family enzyme
MAKAKSLLDLIAEAQFDEYGWATENYEIQMGYQSPYDAFEGLITYLQDIEVMMPHPERNREMARLLYTLQGEQSNRIRQIQERLSKIEKLVKKDD